VSDLTLFAMGLVVAIPAAIVVVGLVIAAAADEREVRDFRARQDAGASRPA